LIFKLSTKMMS